MNRDILLNKTENIRICIIFNLQRCCEACIELAMHSVSELKLGVSQSSRDAFEMLYNKGIIDEKLKEYMSR
ncbi:type VII toxin-antitoxin system HepT family RNase toxin [Paenibacillus durus]|uniref:Uncharacterized protein n=1 Tax=Paenibacillus durus ATCC 35681 TaxID=1333534 RepID=A0A0F7CGL8_PAEDU|nr:HepT-like ribonuclease domain-containing protein [Paenibacillus durus]AKG33631.1 hypothetical protein VK70_02695 [Paenibacillus durus ATCC 35681]